MAGRPRKTMGEAHEALPLAVSGDAGEAPALPAYQREHPDMLTGDALKTLAHRQGMAKSELATMSDDKIRDQLKYLAYRRASDDSE